MAITILSTPQGYPTAYNPIEFGVSSTNVSQTNFRYVCDIYLSGVTGYTRLKTDVDPANNYGIFDIHRVIENYLTHDIDKTVYAQALNANSYIPFECKFGEEYGPSSGIIVYPNLSFSGIFYAFNGILDYNKFVGYDDEDFFAAVGNRAILNRYWVNDVALLRDTSQMLESKKIRFADDAWLHYMTSGIINRVEVIAYDSTGATIKTSQFTGSYTAADTNYLHRFIRIPAGPNNLNLITSGDITLNSQPLIPSNTHYYTLQLKRASPSQTFSNAFVFYIQDCDSSGVEAFDNGFWDGTTVVCTGGCVLDNTYGTLASDTTLKAGFVALNDESTWLRDYKLKSDTYYKITYTATLTAAKPNIKWRVEGTANTQYRTANGTYTEYIRTNFKGRVLFRFIGTANADGEVTLSAISAQEVKPTTRIHFLNKLGAFESMNFNALNKKNESIEKNNYKKVTGKWSGTTFTRDSFDRMNVTYNTKIKETFSCNTGWIDRAEVSFIEEMISSPAAYLDDGVKIWGINITNTGFEWKQHEETKLFNYVIEFEMFDRYRQRY